MSGVAAVAALPMYDWPELRKETDQFWERLRDSLSCFGFPAPQSLDRNRPMESIWRDENLLLAQCCGLPYVTDLSDTVSLIGTPAYELDCGAGSYYSVVVVHADCDVTSMKDVAGLRLAYNSANSQSGYAALAYHLRQNGPSPNPFAESHCTGSHRASIISVAERQTDLAAIDAVTWKIARRHERATENLRVLAVTEPTPGLPFICANSRNRRVDRIHLAVVEAMASLDEDCRQALLLSGFAPTLPSDYDIIRTHHELIASAKL